MLRFTIKILALLLLIFIFVKGSAYLGRRELDPENYLAALRSKHQRLDESSLATSSSRLIFIGDSSLPFGLDASALEKALKMPVINLGLHAAFGLPFVLKEVYPDLRPGDKVILVMHYYPSDEDKNDGVTCHALDFYPEMYQRLDLNFLAEEKLRFICDLKRTRRYLMNKSAHRAEPDKARLDYKTWALESDGDFKDQLYQNPDQGFMPSAAQLITFSQDETIVSLKEFQVKYQEKGAQLWLIYPPYPKTGYNTNVAALNDYDKLMRTQTALSVLNQPADSVYEDSLFFNSDYHLTAQGKNVYTRMVTEIIKKKLNQ